MEVDFEPSVFEPHQSFRAPSRGPLLPPRPAFRIGYAHCSAQLRRIGQLRESWCPQQADAAWEALRAVALRHAAFHALSPQAQEAHVSTLLSTDAAQARGMTRDVLLQHMGWDAGVASCLAWHAQKRTPTLTALPCPCGKVG